MPRSPGPSVAPVAQPVRDNAIVRHPRGIVRVTAHDFIMPLQQAPVAVHLPDVPGVQRTGACPTRANRAAPVENDVLRGDVGHQTAVDLRLGHVLRDLRVEPRRVVVVHDRPAQQVRNLQPAELLAVRAVGEHALQVAADRRLDQLVDAVQQRIGAREAAGRLGGIVNELAAQVEHPGNRRRRLGLAVGNGPFDLHVAKAVIGEAGRPCLRLHRPATCRKTTSVRPSFSANHSGAVQQFAGNELHLCARPGRARTASASRRSSGRGRRRTRPAAAA